MPRGTTTRGAIVRQRIIKATGKLMRAQGVANTSLDDIGATAGVSRSQLFHYFPDGREQLLIAVLQYEADRVLADQDPFLHQLTSWDNWTAWRDLVIRRYKRQGKTCPMSMLISQLGAGSRDAATAVTAELLNNWKTLIEEGILTMRDQGQIDPNIDACSRASAVLAAIQGGVVMLTATGEIGHLEAALDHAIEALRDVVLSREVLHAPGGKRDAFPARA